jgi:hypothetical protein
MTIRGKVADPETKESNPYLFPHDKPKRVPNTVPGWDRLPFLPRGRHGKRSLLQQLHYTNFVFGGIRTKMEKNGRVDSIVDRRPFFERCDSPNELITR